MKWPFLVDNECQRQMLIKYNQAKMLLNECNRHLIISKLKYFLHDVLTLIEGLLLFFLID